MNIYYKLDDLALKREWHLKFPRAYMFYLWVVIPRRLNGDFGFKEWFRWVRR